MTHPAPAATNSIDVLVIGAGPTGLACAIDAQNAGFRTMLVDVLVIGAEPVTVHRCSSPLLQKEDVHAEG